MAGRERLTWDGGTKAAGKQPVLPVERAASAHPATPDEGPAHPANKPDPGEHDYENGDTSSWAEDPTTGPYPDSAHPATPDEGPASPAYKSDGELPANEPGGAQVTNDDLGVTKAAADQLRIAVEKRAAKCVRVATVMLQGFTSDTDTIEHQAFDLMDLPDANLQSTLDRLAKLAEDDEDDEDDKEGCKDKKAEDEDEDDADKKAADDEDDDDDDDDGKKAADDKLLRKLLAEEGMIAAEDEDEDDDKKASADKSALDQVLAELKGISGRLDTIEGKAAMDPDEANLAAMLEEEGLTEEGDVESMLREMADAEVVDEIVEEEPVAMEDPIEMDIDMGPAEDPMGMLDDTVLEDEDEALLSSLFADSRLAGDDDDDDDDDDSDDGDDDSDDGDDDGDKEAKKASAQKPRAKKASTGATRLGGVSREAGSDTAELEKLWPTAPDVSDVFK
jgi:hypothetical protein